MRYLLWLILPLTFVGNGVYAQAYNNELSIGYGSTDSSFIDATSYELLYSYYFTSVRGDTGPLAYAELIERPSRIEAGYTFFDYDPNQVVSNAEESLVGVLGHYYKDDYGLVVGLVKQQGETEISQPALKVDTDTAFYSVAGVYYPEKYTRATMGLSWGDREFQYSSLLVDEKVDLKRYFVQLEQLVYLPENRYFVISGLLARYSQKDQAGTGDASEVMLELGYYFTRFSGLNVSYGLYDGEGANRQESYGFGYEHFVSTATSVALGYQHAVDEVSADDNEYSLRLTLRF